MQWEFPAERGQGKTSNEARNQTRPGLDGGDVDRQLASSQFFRTPGPGPPVERGGQKRATATGNRGAETRFRRHGESWTDGRPGKQHSKSDDKAVWTKVLRHGADHELGEAKWSRILKHRNSGKRRTG